jgi:glycosyltransferase involved in cell wall biosynthesis
MLLSIIIPVYNVESYLIECLDSIFSQERTNCEIIAINDGSTDNSLSILTQYQTLYPELIVINQDNRGLSGARNTGIRHAKGSYLYFLDSDDYLLSGSIATIIHYINTTQAEIIGFNARTNESSIYILVHCKSMNQKSGMDFFIAFDNENKFFPAVNVFLYVFETRFLTSNHLFFKEGVFHEDLLFMTQAFCLSKKTCWFNEIIYHYRTQREGSISTDVQLKNLSDKSTICRKIIWFFEQHDSCNKYVENFVLGIYLFTLIQGVDHKFSSKKAWYFTQEDKKLMRRGIRTEYEFKLWFLASINDKLMVNYYQNTLSPIIRRTINILLGSIYRMMYSNHET